MHAGTSLFRSLPLDTARPGLPAIYVTDPVLPRDGLTMIPHTSWRSELSPPKRVSVGHASTVRRSSYAHLVHRAGLTPNTQKPCDFRA